MDKMRTEGRKKEGLGCGLNESQSMPSQRTAKDSLLPELKLNEEIFATAKKYLNRVQSMETAIRQDTEQSDLTEFRGKARDL